MPLDQLERAKASTPNKPSTSHRGSMPRDRLERAKGFVAESLRHRFQVYPQESMEPPGRSSKPDYLRRKLERSKARSFPPRPIRQIQVGRTTYVLNSPLIGVFQRGAKGIAFRVDELLPHFVGEGATAEGAYREWCEHVHVFIQRMRAVSPSLRNEDESVQWTMICEYIDIDNYERTQPIKVCRRGAVTSSWPHPWRITWADGSVEEIALDIMPDEFGAFETGDALEATLDQNPVSGKTLYVFSVKPIVADGPSYEAGAIEFWRSLTQTEDLPESHRDWTK